MSDNPHLNLNHQELKRVDEFRQSRKTAVLTILFTDIVGFTELIETAGEHKSQEIKQIHDELFIEIVTRDGAGEIVKQIGDSFLAIFSEPSTAVERSLEFQSELNNIKDQITLGHYTLQVRAGLHLGQVSLEDSLQADIFGGHVNKAARIMSIACGGQILTSDVVRDNAVNWLKDKGINTKYYGKTKLKGFSEFTSIHEFYHIETRPIGIPKVLKNNRIKFISSILFISFISVAIIIGLINYYYNNIHFEDVVRDNFVIHFSSNEKLIQDFINTNIMKDITGYQLIEDNYIELIRKNVIPRLNSKIATLDIHPHYPENDKEYELMERLSLIEYYPNKHPGDSIPKIADEYEARLKEINAVFDYFENKYSKHIDSYILIPIAEFNRTKHGNNLFSSPAIYRDENREIIYNEYSGICGNCLLTWNKDSLQMVYDEIVYVTNNLMKKERFGGTFVGNVNEILDENLISIDLENTRIVKGMKLSGKRIYVYGKGEKTLNQYISDRQDIINYYQNHPDELEKMRTKQDWRPTNWYASMNNIDELLLFFKNDIDSIKTNFNQVTKDWESRGEGGGWDGIMRYSVEIIKVTDNEAIGKIIYKKAPYVTSQIGDVIQITN